MVTLLYFARVREALGTGEERIDLPDGVATVTDLADWLATRHPVFADRDRLRVAVDQVMARFDTDIRSAKEIAFFPPVTGG
ncbi:molybdopterin converting factor subunit 1 [Sphingomonas sp. SUN039]|uniref:molybdopterin converting factor subunit 1 n=1 Tax=Sphingomonas sp. SUN039 TaxID=2937787 RepID=UPI0021644697|nr:molybdopterin converting factor subunit 1 [Sphingomonas sp. SUN039]UVO54096.1 molybdopterin converting factor subunit 1 [Sphingomonas sp. SUN039]